METASETTGGWLGARVTSYEKTYRDFLLLFFRVWATVRSIHMSSYLRSEMTVPRAMWQRRWLVLVTVVVFGLLGAVFASMQGSLFSATANLVVQDPRVASVFDNSGTFTSTRYVQNQVAIIQSTAVGQRASELLAGEYPSAGLDSEFFVRSAAAVGSRDSDEITITLAAPSAELAVAGVNAITQAYQELLRSEATRGYAFALAELDDSIGANEGEFRNLQNQIDDLRASTPALPELDAQLTETLERLVEVQSQFEGASESQLGPLRTELGDILLQLQTMQAVGNLEAQNSDLSTLLDEQRAVIQRRLQLIERRDEIAVDAELLSSGVSLVSPARFAEERGVGTARAVAVGVAFGLLVGAALAYVLAARRRNFASRHEPELILGAPLLADIPRFSEEGVKSVLPVRENPRSASAEAFRFASTVLEIQTAASGLRSLAVVSGTLGNGKTTFTANLALAAARRGNDVLGRGRRLWQPGADGTAGRDWRHPFHGDDRGARGQGLSRTGHPCGGR